MRRAFLEREGLNKSFDRKIIPYQKSDNKVLASFLFFIVQEDH
jgi:hypothetical protein